MADLTHMLYFVLTCYLCGFASGVNDTEEEEVKAGDDATLKCQDSNIGKVEKLVWIRSDLGRKLYVLFYRENRIYENIQDPSFSGRVTLSDPHMKNGNVSLILSNTSTDDTGTYECYILGRRSKRAVSEVQHVVKLKVKTSTSPGGTTEDGGKEDGVRAHFLPIIPVSVVIIAVISEIGISKTLKKKKSALPAPPDKEVEQQLV